MLPMSQIKKLLTALLACLLFAGCDDPLETPPVAERVLLVYLAADNNLSGNALDNIESLKEGMGAVSRKCAYPCLRGFAG